MPYQTDGVTAGHRDVERRWEAIGSHLPEAPFTSLDVGCAEGWLTSRLAAYGPAVGIDNDTGRFHHNGFELVTEQADAQSLARFLPSNVVLLLSILHHMTDGLRVFNLCRDHSKVLFVELPHPSEKGVARKCPDLDTIRGIVEFHGEALVATPGFDKRHERTLWKL